MITQPTNVCIPELWLAAPHCYLLRPSKSKEGGLFVFGLVVSDYAEVENITSPLLRSVYPVSSVLFQGFNLKSHLLLSLCHGVNNHLNISDPL